MTMTRDNNNPNDDDLTQLYRRRDLLSSLLVTVASTTITFPKMAHADTIATTIDMKTFVDPQGLFQIQIPTRFFAIRRTVKGDLPNEQTGKGRRGSSIFTAGDMAKAEVIAIERYPFMVLLQEEGGMTMPINDKDPNNPIRTFSEIGKADYIAEWIALRRDRDRQSQSTTANLSATKIVPGSVQLLDNDQILQFELRTDINVQKPDLLLEQTGSDQLIRKTLARATLKSQDGQLMAVFASALSQDWEGEDGKAMRVAVGSFTATNRSQ